MAPVEQVEERARQQQQVGQDAEEVRGVLGDHEEPDNHKECQEDEARA
jgi:hypothetical protein